MTKFSPVYHSAVVSNYRARFMEEHKTECCLPDPRIWDIQDSIVLPTSEEQEEFTLETMKEEHDSSFSDNGILKDRLCSFTVRFARSGLDDDKAEKMVEWLQRELTRVVSKVASESHCRFTVDN